MKNNTSAQISFYENLTKRSLTFLDMFKKHINNRLGEDVDYGSYDDVVGDVAAEIAMFTSMHEGIESTINGDKWIAQLINVTYHRIAISPGTMMCVMTVMVINTDAENVNSSDAMINMVCRCDIQRGLIPEVLYKTLSNEPITMTNDSTMHDGHIMCALPMWDFYAFPSMTSHMNGKAFSMDGIRDIDMHHGCDFSCKVERLGDSSYKLSLSKDTGDNRNQLYKLEKIKEDNLTIEDRLIAMLSGENGWVEYSITNFDNHQMKSRCHSCNRWHVQIIVNTCMNIIIEENGGLDSGFKLYNRSGLDTSHCGLFIDNNGDDAMSSHQ